MSKDMIFFWVNKNRFTSIKQIHTGGHTFVKLDGGEVEGYQGFDLAKMVRDNLEFSDSKTTWQLQVAEMSASA
jgi:hypothetical protein